MAEKEKHEFRLYCSRTKQKEIFKPKDSGKVGLYVCGVTSYDLSHIGHARASVAFDVLYRYLRHLGYEVTYVRNFTDVDDKIIVKANELGEDPLALSSRFCEEFLNDMADLGCLPPSYQPRVSGHMDQIKDMIAQIISNGFAYPVDGDVYFSVDSYPSYGQLSRRKPEDNRAGERVTVDSRKRNPADFALWKAAKPGEPIWDSPWGPGRPGWHIECSAMSATYLTPTFDIHGGGEDLIFPHHENEIAQSHAACSNSNVSYWMHNGLIMINGQKMSKSLGNYYTIREVTERYHPLAVRHFLLGTCHYRSPINFTLNEMEISSASVLYIYQTLQDCATAVSRSLEGNEMEGTSLKSKTTRITKDAQYCISNLKNEVERNMADDLHTPRILDDLPEALRSINSHITQLKKEKNKQKQLSNIQSLVELEASITGVLDMLGLLSSSPYSEVLQQLKEKALKRAELTEGEVAQLIEKRVLARVNKDFTLGDKIRADLADKGIALEDVGQGTIWKPCVRKVQERPRLHRSGENLEAAC